MFYVSWATPFAAIIGWYALSEFCYRYHLESMTELVHPYFVLMVGIAAGLLPILKYRERLKKRLSTMSMAPLPRPVDTAPPVLIAPLKTSTNTMPSLASITSELQKKLHGEIEECHQANNKLEHEIKALRREMKAFAISKNEEIQKLERKVIGLENQLELYQIMRNESVNEKGILDALVNTPLKMLGVKHAP